jgi:Inner membrane protein YgaP-like, transmembrane domain
MGLVRFLQSAVGRGLRAVLGVGLVAAGAVLGDGWLALAVIGLVPLIAGATGVCLVAPLFHAPIRGAHRS